MSDGPKEPSRLLWEGVEDVDVDPSLRASPPASSLLTKACSTLEQAAELAEERVDATLTSVGEDELRRRAMTDDRALAEITRRQASLAFA